MRTQPPAGSTYLYLVRHAATPPNERRPYILQGNGIDGSLSESGLRQAAEVAQFLADFPVNHVYCSSMKRARETATAIARHHRLEIIPHQGLVECSVGHWEGLDWETIKQNYSEPARLFLENPAIHPYFGGESYTDVLNRVRPHLKELLERHRGQCIVVVGHNVVNRVYLADLMGIELRRAKELRQQNACVNLIVDDGIATHVVTMNSIFHLSEPPL